MVIEVILRGQVLTRAEVPDEDLDLPGASWQRAVSFREDVIRLQLMKLEDRLRDFKDFLKQEAKLEYRLVFRSKLHHIDETEQDTGADSGGDQGPDAGRTEDDPENAE